MKRRQLFEFCDQSWLPDIIRDAVYDCLAIIHRLAQPYRNSAKLYEKLAEVSGQAEVLDLGSGTAVHLEPVFRAPGAKLPRIVVSDIYPNVSYFAELSERFGKERIAFHPEPLSFLDSLKTPYRAVSMCTAFHHLSEPDAAKLVASVAESRRSLLILELNARSVSQFLLTFLAVPLLFAAPFFAKKKHPLKFVFGCFIPIVPVIVLFDGLVSSLRAYTEADIRAMIPSGLSPETMLDFERTPYFFGIFCGSAALIYPRG